MRPVHPDRSRMGALVRLVILTLGDEAHSVLTPAGVLHVRAAAATLDHDVLPLSPNGLAILRRLARNPGEVVSRDRLLEVLPGESSDPHTAEVAVARLREALAPPRPAPAGADRDQARLRAPDGLSAATGARAVGERARAARAGGRPVRDEFQRLVLGCWRRSACQCPSDPTVGSGQDGGRADVGVPPGTVVGVPSRLTAASRASVSGDQSVARSSLVSEPRKPADDPMP